MKRFYVETKMVDADTKKGRCIAAALSCVDQGVIFFLGCFLAGAVFVAAAGAGEAAFLGGVGSW